jgi:hypothetical protein
VILIFSFHFLLHSHWGVRPARQDGCVGSATLVIGFVCDTAVFSKQPVQGPQVAGGTEEKKGKGPFSRFCFLEPRGE